MSKKRGYFFADVNTCLTQEGLKNALHYDPLTGAFTWTGNDVFGQRLRGQGVWKRGAGRPAGSQTKNKQGGPGHIRIGFDSSEGVFLYLGHRLAWLYMTGKWPDDQVDHKNRLHNDNRWRNLRDASNDENQANRGLRPHNVSGITGVAYHPSQGLWHATCSIGGVRILHSYFHTEEEAVTARAKALSAQGEFAVAVQHGG